MRIDAQARKEIKLITQKIGNGLITVTFGLADNGYVRAHFSSPGQKARQFKFDRVSRCRTHLPQVIRTATEIIREMKEVADTSFRSKQKLGSLGEALVEKLEPPVTVALVPEPEPLELSDENFAEPPDVEPPQEEVMPRAIKTLVVVPKGLPPIPPPAPAPAPGSKHICMSKIENIKATRYLDKCRKNDESDPVYEYHDGYSDDVIRRLVNPRLTVESIAKHRRIGFGKTPQEMKPNKLTKNEQINKLIDRVEELELRVMELEEENAKLKAAGKPSRLGLPNGRESAGARGDLRVG